MLHYYCSVCHGALTRLSRVRYYCSTCAIHSFIDDDGKLVAITDEDTTVTAQSDDKNTTDTAQSDDDSSDRRKAS